MCARIRTAGLSQTRVHHRVQSYLLATDPTDHGKHGLLHEYGQWFALSRMREYDDTALTNAWELFSSYYVTVAPMHAFLATCNLIAAHRGASFEEQK